MEHGADYPNRAFWRPGFSQIHCSKQSVGACESRGDRIWSSPVRPEIILLVNTSGGAWCKSEPLSFSRVRRRTNFLLYNKLENSNFQKCPGKALITSFMIIYFCVCIKIRKFSLFYEASRTFAIMRHWENEFFKSCPEQFKSNLSW